MVSVNTSWYNILLGFKLTNLFGIKKCSDAKDSGGFLLYIAVIIIITITMQFKEITDISAPNFTVSPIWSEIENGLPTGRPLGYRF